MNADLTAIIAEVLAEHRVDSLGCLSDGCWNPGGFVTQEQGEAHQAEQIAARLLELPAPTFARWWCDDRAERLRALESP